MEIKQQIQQLVESISKDEKLKADFMKDPVKTVENTLGVDLPDDIIEKVAEGVKAKLTADDLKKLAGSFLKFK